MNKIYKRTMKLFLLSVILIITGCKNTGKIIGYWAGTMQMNGKTIDIAVNLDSANKSFSSNDLMLMEQPISDLTINNENVSFSIDLDVEVVFNGTLSDNQIMGTATIAGASPNMVISFSLDRLPEKPVKPYTVENFRVNNDDVSLSAQIYKPGAESLHPAVVLMHGASTNLKSDYIFDADYFARLGFEVLIFDKRGSGESTGDYFTSTYDDLTADAIACLRVLYSRESVDKNKIGVWGLSQGALLLPKIAAKTNIPKFVIAKSPDVISAVHAAAFQDSLRVVMSGSSEMQGHIAAESHRTVKRMINEGKSNREVEEYINNTAEKYPFMNNTGLYGSINISRGEYEGFYWKGRTETFIRYWEELDIPALVLFGGRDNLVNTLINEAVLQKIDNPNIEIITFPKANHVLKKAFDPSEDSEFDFPRLIEGYKRSVEKWIGKVFDK